MGFHEIQLPPGISYGSRVGPGWGNAIVELDSEADEVVQRRTSPRLRADLGYSVRTYEDVATIKKFYNARGGAANSWRFKDWSDYCTTSSGTLMGGGTIVDDQDVVIGTGDGTTTQFQLVKRYTSGSQTLIRTIRKPIVTPYTDSVHAYTGVRIALDSTEQTSGFSVDGTTGLVTFSSAPGNGVQVKAGFEFDVPMRFDEETDRWLSITPATFDSANLESIMVVEQRFPAGDPEDVPYLGSKRWGNIAANQQHSFLNGYGQSYTPTTGGLKVFAPDATILALGGPYGIIQNEGGSNSFDFKTQADVLIATVPVNGSIEVWLGDGGSGTKVWKTK